MGKVFIRAYFPVVLQMDEHPVSGEEGRRGRPLRDLEERVTFGDSRVYILSGALRCTFLLSRLSGGGP